MTETILKSVKLQLFPMDFKYHSSTNMSNNTEYLLNENRMEYGENIIYYLFHPKIPLGMTIIPFSLTNF